MLGAKLKIRSVRLFICLLALSMTSASFGKFIASHQKIGDVGKIEAYSTDTIQDAVVEKVTFYPKAATLGDSRIERDGLLVRYTNAVATVLICHGFMCDKNDSNILRQIFPRGRYNVMTFDFRAHGEKKGDLFCTLGGDEALDVAAAAHFIKQHPDLKNLKLFVYAFSMGSVASIEAQAKDSSLFDGMVLDCPYDRTINVLKNALGNIKFTLAGYTFGIPCSGFLEKYAFHPYVQSILRFVLRAVANMDSRGIALRAVPVHPADSVTKIKVPTYYICCKKDPKVTKQAIELVYENTAATYKKLWRTNGRFHFDSYFYNPEKYSAQVVDFLEMILNGTAHKTVKKEIIEDEPDEPLVG